LDCAGILKTGFGARRGGPASCPVRLPAAAREEGALTEEETECLAREAMAARNLDPRSRVSWESLLRACGNNGGSPIEPFYTALKELIRKRRSSKRPSASH
jgi:hypothetical protein